MKALRAATSAGIYPVLVTAATGIMLTASPGLDPAHLALLGGAVLMAVAIIVLTLERAIPYRPDWNLDQGDLRTDLLHMTVSYYVVLQILKALLVLAFLSAPFLVYRPLSSKLWPAGGSVLIQLALALLIGEFFLYWAHRAFHEVDGLWAFHRVHHSSKRIYWLNSARFHPVDIFLQSALGTIPLMLLGIPEHILQAYFVLTATHGLVQHSNIDIKLGPLNRIFSITEVHRWHHSINPEESNRNFGKVLLLFDHLFGTFYYPENRQASEIGIAEIQFPIGFLDQVKEPFRR